MTQHPAAGIENNNQSLDPRLEAGVKVYTDVLFSCFLYRYLINFLSFQKVFQVIDTFPL